MFNIVLVVSGFLVLCSGLHRLSNFTALLKMKKQMRGRVCGCQRPSYQFLYNVWQNQLMGQGNRDCDRLYDSGTNTDGVYTIDVQGNSLEVVCDFQFNGNNWIMIQRRMTGGGLGFNVGWAAYQGGFGTLDVAGEFWLGLNAIHRLSYHLRRPVLRIDITAAGNMAAYAEYKIFRVAGERQKYRLRVGEYVGTADDGMAYHNGAYFSTMDNDNDQEHFRMNCAQMFGGGGWWYKDCFTANLHGSFTGSSAARDNVNWYFWRSSFDTLQTTEMRIRNG